ncbi:LysR family transcriptional regulator [Neobacillus mesonae]|nr:LysR family transcriptional regulator [Neobacillus mesonae]
MDVRQLKYFLAIAQEGQITRAAKRLNMEQPPLSRQLKQMEDELGLRLFDRDGKGLILTDAGKLLMKKAEVLLHQFDDSLREVMESEKEPLGVLSVGSVVSCISLLPNKIKEFHERYPLVKFKILEGDHLYLSEQLETRVVDLVLARLPFESLMNPEQYQVLRLPSDPFVVVIPASWHSYADQSSIHMSQLSSFSFLTLKTEKTIRMHEQVVNECIKHGFTPDIICECSSVAILMSLISSGIGASVFPKSIMSSFPAAGVKMLEIEDADFQSDVGIVWLKDRYLSKSARSFIEQFKTVQ